MESFHWDKHFVTGLAEVDDQHHHLVDVINQFGELLTRQEEAVFDDIEKVFGELAAYAKYHFTEEESLMVKVGIDPRHLAHHQHEHINFLQEVTQMHAGISPENTDKAKPLLKFLIYWLAYHILGSDQAMAKQIVAIQSGQTAVAAYLAEERMKEGAVEPLLHALNGLFRQVSERNRELLQLNQTLEARVAERTNELAIANRQMEEIALTDVLTGLPNRRHAMRCLGLAWEESIKLNTPLSCMMIDADGFKQINDNYGHDAGDEVLRQLSGICNILFAPMTSCAGWDAEMSFSWLGSLFTSDTPPDSAAMQLTSKPCVLADSRSCAYLRVIGEMIVQPVPALAVAGRQELELQPILKG